MDLSLFKNTPISETASLQFRAGSFNLFNRANSGAPNTIVFGGTAISSTAGLIATTATTSRQIQFGLKRISSTEPRPQGARVGGNRTGTESISGA